MNRISTKSHSNFGTRKISINFGGVKAVNEVDLTIREKEILGLIGPNGAGKTTLLNLMTGILQPSEGGIFLDDKNFTGKKPYWWASKGIGRTFQNVNLFSKLSVLENIEIAAIGVGVNKTDARKRASELLSWIKLDEFADFQADTLPSGEGRKLGILRALAINPCFLLLDEPAAGLNENESDEVVEFINQIMDRFNCGVLVIEHDMRFIMKLCSRIHVINYGKTIAIGSPKEIMSNQTVIDAYLGCEI